MTNCPYYKILDIPESADALTIKKAYFKKIKQFPPNIYPDKFKEIKKAYDILSSPDRRKLCDLYGDLSETTIEDFLRKHEGEELEKFPEKKISIMGQEINLDLFKCDFCGNRLASPETAVKITLNLQAKGEGFKDNIYLGEYPLLYLCPICKKNAKILRDMEVKKNKFLVWGITAIVLLFLFALIFSSSFLGFLGLISFVTIIPIIRGMGRFIDDLGRRYKLNTWDSNEKIKLIIEDIKTYGGIDTLPSGIQVKTDVKLMDENFPKRFNRKEFLLLKGFTIPPKAWIFGFIIAFAYFAFKDIFHSATFAIIVIASLVAILWIYFYLVPKGISALIESSLSMKKLLLGQEIVNKLLELGADK